MTSIRNARIVLGVTGGIAAYKAADVASKLVQAGATVHVVLTEAAEQFVGRATFEAITKQPVHLSVFEPWRDDWFGHVSLGELADVIVIAPATANTLAKLASGLADDMLGATVLASSCPLLIAPAMEHKMLHHPATAANIETLTARGAVMIGPETGRLASGDAGDGRMSEPVTIIGAIRKALGESGVLAGRRVVVTAGGTRERVDPIRFVGNRSSGLMGYSIAQSMIDRGAQVTLISGPVALPAPYGAELVQIESAAELLDAVRSATRGADALIMSAAVSDYRPSRQFTSKIKKDQTGDGLTVEFVTNPDIVAEISEPGLIKVGFAAETENLIENARRKLQAKALDMVIANDAERTIGSPDSQATLIYPDGRTESLEPMPKADLADLIADRVATLIDKNGPARR